MSDGTSHSSHGRSLFGLFLPMGALFVMALSIGTGSVTVFWLGSGLAVAAVVFHSRHVIVPTRARRPIEGSARVISASAPPPGVTTGRCELQLVIEVPGAPATAQTIRDTAVPIAKWPIPGARLPIYVQRSNPRTVTIRWDRARNTVVDQGTPFVTQLTTTSTEVGREPPPNNPNDDELGSYLDELFSSVTEVSPAVAADVDGAAPTTAERKDVESSALPAFVLPEFAPLDLPEFALADFPDPVQPATPADPGADADDAATTSSAGKVPLPRREPRPLDGAQWGLPPDTEAEVTDRASRLLDPGVLTGGRATYEAAGGVEEEQPAIQGVGVSLMVSDLPRSLEFYRDTLGFTELDSSGAAAILVAGDAKLLLRQLDDARAEGHRLSHVNLEVADVDAVYSDLRAKGIRFMQRPRAVAGTALMELWSVSFRDPDGHGLALTSWRYR